MQKHPTKDFTPLEPQGMTSYEDRLKQIENSLDSPSSALPVTANYTKTVGFPSSGPSLKVSGEIMNPTNSIPIAIPGKKTAKEGSPTSGSLKDKLAHIQIPQSPTNAARSWQSNNNGELFDNYKSQLSGWSVERPQSPGPKSPVSSSLKQTPPAQKETTISASAPVPKPVKEGKESKQPQQPKQEKQQQQKGKEKQTQQKDGDQKAAPVPKQTKAPQGTSKKNTPPVKEAAPILLQPVTKPTQAPQPTQLKDSKKKAKAEEKAPKSEKGVSLFSHLPQYEKSSIEMKPDLVKNLHPVIVDLGLKYAQGTIVGSNARCVAFLNAISQVIKDFEPVTGNFHKEFDTKHIVNFLVSCRPLSVSLGAIVNYVKLWISQSMKCQKFEESKQYVLDQIDKFLQERVFGADQTISKYALSKINDNDVIMTFARSHVVEMALISAWQSGKRFRVIVVDSKPKREGKELLRRLVKAGLDCSYVTINAVSYIMKEVTKVFLGAHTMMYNGNLLSRCGSALVALVAQTYQVPVIVLCETFKFTEKVHLESFSLNELADPDEFVNSSVQLFEEKKIEEPEPEKKGLPVEKPQTLQNWREVEHLKVLNLAYDLCPAQFITMVITEVGMVPPSSVPVILREHGRDFS